LKDTEVEPVRLARYYFVKLSLMIPKILGSSYSTTLTHSVPEATHSGMSE